MPNAYIIAELTIADPAAYRASGYMAMAAAAVAAHGGRYLVRGSPARVLEGGPEPGRIVVLEFPSLEAALAFHGSVQYGPALKLRQSLSEGRLVLLDGLDGAAP